MNVYTGVNRRQLGTGVWSTITRGIRPIIMSIFHKLKPHAVNAARNAAQSALRAGTHLATDAMIGKLDKEQVKNVLKNEGGNLKRKILEDLQSGKGHKRRRISKPRKDTMKRRNFKCNKRKNSKCRKRKASKRKPIKRLRNKTVNKRVGKTTKRNKRRSTVSKKALKDIFS